MCERVSKKALDLYDGEVGEMRSGGRRKNLGAWVGTEEQGREGDGLG